MKIFEERRKGERRASGISERIDRGKRNAPWEAGEKRAVAAMEKKKGRKLLKLNPSQNNCEARAFFCR